jgi:hypothetical protein
MKTRSKAWLDKANGTSSVEFRVTGSGFVMPNHINSDVTTGWSREEFHKALRKVSRRNPAETEAAQRLRDAGYRVVEPSPREHVEPARIPNLQPELREIRGNDR